MDLNIDLAEVQEQAQREIYEERFAEAVAKEKQKMLTKKGIFDWIPFRILIVRK